MKPETAIKLREAKEELSYLNGNIVFNLRQYGYSADSKAKTLTWGVIRLAYREKGYFPRLLKRQLKYESYFELKGNSIVLDEAKFVKQIESGVPVQMPATAREIPTERTYTRNGRRVIERIID